MTIIAASASATISLPQGKRLSFTGNGIAVIGPGPRAGQQIVGTAATNLIGPYPQDQVIYLTATTQIDYSIAPDFSIDGLAVTTDWDNSEETFTGLKLNVTDTASAAASLLMDLQVGGVSKFKIDKNGNETLTGSLTLVDTILIRDAANTLAQRNGTAAQSFRLYNTFTDASNYERLSFKFVSNQARINTEGAGTGMARDLYLDSSAVGILANEAVNSFFWTSTAFHTVTNGVRDLGLSSVGWKRLYIDYTNTATVGAVTINKAAGRVNIAAAGTSVVVTNSLVTAASHVLAIVSQNDATAQVLNVVPAAGSFTITLQAAATAQTSIDFFVISAD